MREAAGATRAAIAGWVLFDWAAQPFFSLIQSFGYAPYFVRVLVGDPVAGQAYWGYGTAVAALVIALLSPAIGVLVDQGGGHKRWIAALGLIYATACALLWFAEPGGRNAVLLALGLFCVGTVAIEIATVVNNAMLPGLAAPATTGRLSGLGAAFGNIGGVIAILLALAFLVANPATGRTLLGSGPLFGLDGTRQEGARLLGPFAALWFCVFILPLLTFMTEVRSHGRQSGRTLGRALKTLSATLRALPREPNLLRFLIANLIYTDGLVALFALGGIFASGILGWSAVHIGLFGIMVTVVGIAGAFAGGVLSDRIGAKSVVILALGLLTLALCGLLSLGPTHIGPWVVEAPRPDRVLFSAAAERAYLALGALIGLSAGALLATTRLVLIALAPPERLAQLLGFFALSGRITAFLGPLCVALATQLMASQRAGIAVLLLFFLTGMAVLATVKTGRAPRGGGEPLGGEKRGSDPGGVRDVIG